MDFQAKTCFLYNVIFYQVLMLSFFLNSVRPPLMKKYFYQDKQLQHHMS